MVDTQTLGDQPILRLDHVDVAVMGECRVQAVARLARLPMPDAIGENDEIASRIEQLPGAEQRAREFRPNELRAASTRSMQDEDRVAYNPLRIALWLAERAVMNAKLRQLLIRCE